MTDRQPPGRPTRPMPSGPGHDGERRDINVGYGTLVALALSVGFREPAVLPGQIDLPHQPEIAGQPAEHEICQNIRTPGEDNTLYRLAKHLDSDRKGRAKNAQIQRVASQEMNRPKSGQSPAPDAPRRAERDLPSSPSKPGTPERAPREPLDRTRTRSRKPSRQR